ncbi:MAG: hypothetical protein EOM49_07440 [Epsilonproteobacteria bacterium]|nr:hypothetical protein [Campylobacterota bacterium]
MSIVAYIKENNLAWQPSFSGELGQGLVGYRGALIIEAGKQLSADRILPPKIQAKQVLVVADDASIKFFACELESIVHFEPFFEKYKAFFTPSTLVVLYVTDLDKNGTFTYEGVTFNAYSLAESSVWNELLDLSNLEKGELKKMDNAEKIEALYEALLGSDCTATAMSFEEVLSHKGESSKKIMGAV